MTHDDSLSPEDKALFRKIAENIVPAAKDKYSSVEIKPNFCALKADVGRSYLSDNYIEAVGADSYLTYCRDGVSAKRLRKLKTGLIAYEATLDLHGLSAEDAKETLLHFLGKQLVSHCRCILLIHGKGGARGQVPLLKNLTNHWLRQLPVVLAFCSALGCDGGSGAMYVLLRRVNSRL